MPKKPNLKNPVAAIRARLGMKLEDFASFVGHGAAMLKQIEAGRKPMSQDLKEKIHNMTAVPLALLDKKELTEEEARLKDVAGGLRVDPIPIRSHSGVLDGSWQKNRWPAALLPEIMALWFCLLEADVNFVLSNHTFRREISNTLSRFGIDEERYQSFKNELGGRTFPGGARTKMDDFLDSLTDTTPYRMAAEKRKQWEACLKKPWLEIEKEAPHREAKSRSAVERRRAARKKVGS